MNDPVREARLRMATAPGLGPVLTRRLEERFGGPAAACEASAQQLARVEGIGRKKADLIRRALDEADVAAEQRQMDRLGARMVTLDDAEYPTLLRHIDDPPPMLFVRGELHKQDGLALAMVGSRGCTAYGREQADRLAGLCSQAGLTIISGGARGIDAQAHRGALRLKGRTIAVLGSGLANPYPSDHAELFDQIADGHGAVISELPMTAAPVAENFPRRNRIISGLSLGVLVVEAAARSGALITARLAAEEHHREVMALPGRVDSKASSGCHKMIREGWASLVTNPAEVLEELGEAGQTLKAAMQEEREAETGQADEEDSEPPAASDDPTEQVLAAIGKDPMAVDDVAKATGLDAGPLQSHLTRLQITGQVERMPGNKVRRRS